MSMVWGSSWIIATGPRNCWSPVFNSPRLGFPDHPGTIWNHLEPTFFAPKKMVTWLLTSADPWPAKRPLVPSGCKADKQRLLGKTIKKKSSSMTSQLRSLFNYHLVIQHSHGKSPFLIGKPSINGPFSMAMLNNQRVKTSDRHQHLQFSKLGC